MKHLIILGAAALSLVGFAANSEPKSNPGQDKKEVQTSPQNNPGPNDKKPDKPGKQVQQTQQVPPGKKPAPQARQPEGLDEKQQDKQVQQQRQAPGLEKKKAEPQTTPPGKQAAPQVQAKPAPTTSQQVQEQNAQRKVEQQEQLRQVHERNAQRKVEQQQKVQQVHDRNAERQQQRRLSAEEQRQRITLQQQSLTQYQRNLAERLRLAQQQAAQLQAQKRLAQYRYQQDYYNRLLQQQTKLQSLQNYNYYNDPYYYTDWSYRYIRDGRNYQTNQYGADMLRQAVNSGYREGYLAGQADRQDSWSPNYRSSYAYQDANFGYNGLYVPQDEYNYYFREGFRRGYEDSFYSRNQYGTYSNGQPSVLESILAGVLNLTSLL